MTPARRSLLAVVLALGLVPGAGARAAEPLPKKLEGITVEEHLGSSVDLGVPFVDERGKPVRLRDYFRDDKPVLLTLNYYRCKMLCNLQLNALTQALRGLTWTPGAEFRVVTISIDHREGPKLATEKRQTHLRALGRGEVEWHFLTGKEGDIRRVADAVGFGYRYDKDIDQYAHPAVLHFLSPTGKITRYVYGIEYEPRDLKFALMEASDGKVGSTVDKIILSCFHYDSSQGRYGPFAYGIMRLGGGVTLAVLSVLLGVLWRRDLRRRRNERDEPPRPRRPAPRSPAKEAR